MLDKNTNLTYEEMDKLCCGRVDVVRFANFVSVLEVKYCDGDDMGMTFYEYVEEISSHMATDEDFQHLTVGEFNNLYGLNIDEDETDLERITDILEANDFGCFYISNNIEDVLKAIEEEEYEAVKLNLEHICLDERIYMSIYGGI